MQIEQTFKRSKEGCFDAKPVNLMVVLLNVKLMHLCYQMGEQAYFLLLYLNGALECTSVHSILFRGPLFLYRYKFEIKPFIQAYLVPQDKHVLNNWIENLSLESKFKI